MNYKAKVNVDGKSFVAKTDANSVAEAYNKIHSAATSNFPGKNIMVFQPVFFVDIGNVPEIFNQIFKGFQ